MPSTSSHAVAGDEIDESQLLDTINDELRCGICCGISASMTQTLCCHIYCMSCITTWVKKTCKIRKNVDLSDNETMNSGYGDAEHIAARGHTHESDSELDLEQVKATQDIKDTCVSTCPCCNRWLSLEFLQPISETNPLVYRMYSKIRISCKYNLDAQTNNNTSANIPVMPFKSSQCDWTGHLTDYVEHLQKCGYTTTSCPNLNCNKVLTRGGIIDHLSVCAYRQITCVTCNCSMEFYTLDTHYCQPPILSRLHNAEIHSNYDQTNSVIENEGAYEVGALAESTNGEFEQKSNGGLDEAANGEVENEAHGEVSSDEFATIDLDENDDDDCYDIEFNLNSVGNSSSECSIQSNSIKGHDASSYDEPMPARSQLYYMNLLDSKIDALATYIDDVLKDSEGTKNMDCQLGATNNDESGLYTSSSSRVVDGNFQHALYLDSNVEKLQGDPPTMNSIPENSYTAYQSSPAEQLTKTDRLISCLDERIDRLLNGNGKTVQFDSANRIYETEYRSRPALLRWSAELSLGGLFCDFSIYTSKFHMHGLRWFFVVKGNLRLRRLRIFICLDISEKSLSNGSTFLGMSELQGRRKAINAIPVQYGELRAAFEMTIHSKTNDSESSQTELISKRKSFRKQICGESAIVGCSTIKLLEDELNFYRTRSMSDEPTSSDEVEFVLSEPEMEKHMRDSSDLNRLLANMRVERYMCPPEQFSISAETNENKNISNCASQGSRESTDLNDADVCLMQLRVTEFGLQHSDTTLMALARENFQAPGSN